VRDDPEARTSVHAPVAFGAFALFSTSQLLHLFRGAPGGIWEGGPFPWRSSCMRPARSVTDAALYYRAFSRAVVISRSTS